MHALSEKEQTALIEKIKNLIKNENLQTAEFELQDFFRKVVLREPEKIKTLENNGIAEKSVLASFTIGINFLNKYKKRATNFSKVSSSL